MTFLVFSVIWALACYDMAQKRGRNPILGAIGGLAFGLLSVIYYWAVGDSREKREAALEAKISEHIKKGNK